MFHRFTAGDDLDLFWGVVCLLVWVLGGFACFVLLSTYRDQSSSYAKLNDRLSCYGAHGMGEKKSPR